MDTRDRHHEFYSIRRSFSAYTAEFILSTIEIIIGRQNPRLSGVYLSSKSTRFRPVLQCAIDMRRKISINY